MVGVAVIGAAAYFLTAKPPAASAPQPAAAALAPSGPAVAAAPVQAPAPASATAGSANVPFNPNAALDQVVAGASADRVVTVAPEKARVIIAKDRFNFTVHANHAGYLYVQMVGSDSNNFYLLFPNAIDKNNRIAAGQTLKLPRPGWRLDVPGPAGTDHFVAIVSDVPRSFASAGLLAGDPFSEFPIARVRQLQQSYTGSTPLFAGTPDCATAPACSPAYGATKFTIDEVNP